MYVCFGLLCCCDLVSVGLLIGLIVFLVGLVLR